MKNDAYFKIKKITKISDLESQKVSRIPESDLSIQTDNSIIQLEHVESSDDKCKIIIKPGCYSILNSSSGADLSKTILKKYKLLESVDNTTQILSEANKFFSKLDIYKKIGRDPKRAILIASPPGVGKIAAINKVCERLLEDKGTAVIIWDTSSVRSSTVNNLFLNMAIFSKNLKKLILVIEDIGGGSTDDYDGPRGADSALLNLLDGMGNPFLSIPTLIISTTNNPEQSVEALIDRPGRFDKVIQLSTPNEEESIKLLEFISKRKLDIEDIEAAKLAAKDGFSIAHLQEIVVRSMLDDVSFLKAAKQLSAHKKKFKNAFQNVRSVGLKK